MKKDEILTTAASLICGDREEAYGNMRDNFTRIGKLWEPILGTTVTPEQVALCMNQVKVARLLTSPDHVDSWVDGAGYLALGGEIATEPKKFDFTSVNFDTGNIKFALLYDAGERKPRVWGSMLEVPTDVKVIDADGDTWTYVDGHWRWGSTLAGECLTEYDESGPFTEIIPE
ncbi:hypothetical protein A5747_13500 [Mycobacterium sp. IS-836]|uniref:DUF6378 domain-containing protein n=1 Tax=Mycobacterium sp. IS-836 TaxID=1834160 RepID=UPI00096F02E4|nr:DUF6378 domain-containing protein [Mycobacterium sp. IS-836]OMC55403.1 hypothetical protein A5747_13500 [Mycobacterium sp. IS-836]